MLTQMSLFAFLQTAEIEKSYKRIWVAYSGGVDSTVLLDLARNTFKNIHAIHINHKQKTQDDQWQEHCVQVCANLQIPLQCIQIDMTQYSAQSMELAARNARRHAWQQVLDKDDLLLLAHHADDQAETILYRLLRGSGPRGLSGMLHLSKIGATTVMRPLLSVSKDKILSYAKSQNLSWLEDVSNADLNMDRNFLRNQVMPLLKTRWPAATTTINRSGNVCEQLLQTMQPKLQLDLQAILRNDGALELSELCQHNLVWQQKLLRAWLREKNLIPSAKHIQLILEEVINARIDATPSIKIGPMIIRRSHDHLFALVDETPEPITYILPMPDSKSLALPDGRIVDLNELFTPVQLANFLNGQITVRLGVIGRKAKKLFQAHAIPPWERHKYPLVYLNERLIGIVGLWSSPRL